MFLEIMKAVRLLRFENLLSDAEVFRIKGNIKARFTAKIGAEIRQRKTERAGINLLPYPVGASNEVKRAVDLYNEPLIADQMRIDEKIVDLEKTKAILG